MEHIFQPLTHIHYPSLSLIHRCSWRVFPRSGDLHDSYKHVFVNVGDTGLDQAAMRGSLRTLFAKRTDYGNMLFVSCGCLKHQYHLVVGGQLKLVDHILRTFDTKVRYFSCLATMSHTWRAHLSKMRTKWSEMHHGTRTEQNRNILFKTPPVAIAGRWASIDSSSDDGVIFFVVFRTNKLVERSNHLWPFTFRLLEYCTIRLWKRLFIIHTYIFWLSFSLKRRCHDVQCSQLSFKIHDCKTATGRKNPAVAVAGNITVTTMTDESILVIHWRWCTNQNVILTWCFEVWYM